MVCSTCGVEKSEEAFRPARGTGKVQRKRQCLECRRAGFREYQRGEKNSAYRAAYREANRERIAAYMRAYWAEKGIERRYGITMDQYLDLVAQQQGKCAVCDREVELHIDHDHETGVVRGLLCGNCNRAAGLLHEEPDRALSLAFYLARAREVDHADHRESER